MWDGDGIPEIVLASGFSMNAKKSAGIVSVLRHNGDPRQPWSIREIDRLPASHRLRWADIDGSGKKVLVNQPLTARQRGPARGPRAHAAGILPAGRMEARNHLGAGRGRGARHLHRRLGWRAAATIF